MTAFNGTSKNFALQIGTVKSDNGSGTNKALVVTSGGTARWVGITDLTAQSATVLGSSTNDTAWAALDGNVLEIGNFTAVYDSNAAALTATAAADAAALLRVGAITYASATSGDTLTLSATGNASGKTATIQLTEATAVLGVAKAGTSAQTTITLGANGILAARDLVIDGLASAAAAKSVNFTAPGAGAEIRTTGTFTVHTTDTTGGTLANVTAGGKATFDQGVGGDALAVVKLGSKFTANGLDVTGKGTAKTTLTMASGGTEMLVGAVTAADGDTPASTTLADVTLKGSPPAGTKNPLLAASPREGGMENGTGKFMQIEHFWDGVREYPAHLLPLFTKLRL